MQSVTAKLKSGTNYHVEVAAGGFTVVSDQASAVGGNNQGPNPKALLLAAIAACTIQTLKMVAPSRGWDLQEVDVTVTFNEVPDGQNPGKKIAQIEEKIEVKGNLSAADLTAIERVAGKCPVLKLVEGPKQVIKQIVKI